MEGEGVAVHVRQELIDADEAVFTVEEGEADGGIREHGVKKGEGFVEAGALILRGGDHAVEGNGELGGLGGGFNGKREVGGVFGIEDERAGGAGKRSELVGDGFGEDGCDDGAADEDEGGPQAGDLKQVAEILAVLAVVGVDPDERVEAVCFVNWRDCFPLMIRRGLEHGGMIGAAETGFLAEGEGELADGIGVGAGEGAAFEVCNLSGADAGRFRDVGNNAVQRIRMRVGKGEGGEGSCLERLIFEAAVHALAEVALLVANEQEREDAYDKDLEEDKSGHELAADRSWSQHRHRKGAKNYQRNAVGERLSAKKRLANHVKSSEQTVPAKSERKTSPKKRARSELMLGPPRLRPAHWPAPAASVSGPRRSDGHGIGRSR